MLTKEIKKSLYVFGFLSVVTIFSVLFTTCCMMRTVPRSMSVEASADRVVKADLVLWKLPFETNAETMEKALEKYQHSKKIILDFLREKGFSAEELVINGPYIHYQSVLYPYRSKSSQPTRVKFNIKADIAVSSRKIEEFRKAMESSDELIQKGVLLGSDYWNAKPKFIYTKLSEIRVDLINEAIQSAKHSAISIAKKNHFKLGRVKSVDKGEFKKESMEASYNESDSYEKVIHFLGHVEFELK